MRTKIYGTLGPACANAEILAQMFEMGMTGLRLNLSHMDLADSEEWLRQVQLAGEKVGIEPKLLIDLQGAELRIGDISPLTLHEGDRLTLGENGVPVPAELLANMQSGQEILLDDGKILLVAKEITMSKMGGSARCQVVRGGVLQKKKSVALPGMLYRSALLTKRDMMNLSQINTYGVTGVMQPFVQSAADLQYLKQAIYEAGAGATEIFAKIENREGVSRLEELLPYADTIVIARGDLGNSLSLWELPGVQYRIGNCCKLLNKPYMVVTQMLASMEHAAVPTRAEVSDIFYAVLHGAAAVMLTGETAVGAYPAEAMKFMCHTVREAEKHRL